MGKIAHTSVVACVNVMLLVPESNMMVRPVANVVEVFPLTEIPVEGSSQLPSDEGWEMNVKFPLNFVVSAPPSVNSASPNDLGVAKKPI